MKTKKGYPPFSSPLLWIATPRFTGPSGSVRCSACLFAAGTCRTCKRQYTWWWHLDDLCSCTCTTLRPCHQEQKWLTVPCVSKVRPSFTFSVPQSVTWYSGFVILPYFGYSFSSFAQKSIFRPLQKLNWSETIRVLWHNSGVCCQSSKRKKIKQLEQ